LEKLRVRADKVKVMGNREYNAGWHTAVDLGNLLTVSEAITMAAIERKESRGAHFREDFPTKDDKNYKFSIVISKGTDGTMQSRHEKLDALPPELQKIIEEMK